MEDILTCINEQKIRIRVKDFIKSSFKDYEDIQGYDRRYCKA